MGGKWNNRTITLRDGITVNFDPDYTYRVGTDYDQYPGLTWAEMIDMIETIRKKRIAINEIIK